MVLKRLSCAVVVICLGLNMVVGQTVGGDIHSEHGLLCGAHTRWQHKYVERHNRMLNGEIPGRYIAAIPVKAGLVDGILGFVSAFLFALLTERTLLIQHVSNLDGYCNQRSIEFGYLPRFVNWSAAPLQLSRDVYGCMLAPYDDFKPSNGCTSTSEMRVSLPAKNHSMTPNDKRVTRFFLVNQGLREQFRKEDMTKYPPNNANDELFVWASNRGVTYRIFDNPYHNATVRGWGLQPHTVFPCLHDFLFRLKPEACIGGCLTVERELHRLGKPEQKTIRIGLHVRAETGSNAPEHFYCLDSLISMYKEQNQNYIILLVTAAKGIQDTALAKYGDKVTFPMGKPDAVVVVDHRADADIDPSKNVTMEICAKRAADDEKGALDSVRDLHLLSLTDVHIVSKDSGFGAVGSLLKPRPTPPLIYQMTTLEGNADVKRECRNEPNGDSWSKFADEWSGI